MRGARRAADPAPVCRLGHGRRDLAGAGRRVGGAPRLAAGRGPPRDRPEARHTCPRRGSRRAAGRLAAGVRPGAGRRLAAPGRPGRDEAARRVAAGGVGRRPDRSRLGGPGERGTGGPLRGPSRGRRPEGETGTRDGRRDGSRACRGRCRGGRSRLARAGSVRPSPRCDGVEATARPTRRAASLAAPAPSPAEADSQPSSRLRRLRAAAAYCPRGRSVCALGRTTVS